MAQAKKKKTPAPKKRRWGRIVLWTLLVLVLTVALAGGVAGLGMWMYLSRDLPRIERLADYRPAAVTQVLAADGSLMAEYYKERRYVIPIKDVPTQVVNCFVAAEDGQFYQHPGVDIPGIIRAAWANFRAGRVVQGGSTITQQVAKELLLSPERTFLRKAKEGILAWRMERYLTKSEILYLYLNQIYLGHGAYGIEAAARTYFGKTAGQLTLAEGALIAGLIKAPNRYSPLRHPRRARTRQEYVLDRMEAEGFATPEEVDTARYQQLDIRLHRPATVDAPYYEETVRRWLAEKYGYDLLYTGGLTVYTACNPRLTADGQKAIASGLEALSHRQGWRGPLEHLGSEQLAAVKARPVAAAGLEPGSEASAVVVAADDSIQTATLRLGAAAGKITLEQVKWARPAPPDPMDYTPSPKTISQVFKPGDVVRVRLVEKNANGIWRLDLVQEPASQAALLAMDNHTGRVRVLIGGRDFSQSEFNRVTQSRRQPGSAFKPFIFATALDEPGGRYTPSSVVLDAPVIFDDPTLPGEKWKPKNYENRFYGPTTLRTALEHSRNVVTVKLLEELGLRKTIATARRLGIESELAPNLSLALGSSGVSLMELTRAYGVFADGGVLVTPILVEKVLDREGKVIYEAKPVGKEVMSPQTAYQMTSLLMGVVQNGTGRQMRELGRPVAGKTGTTNDLRDAWFVGFSPQLLCGVWVGQDDNRPLGRRETGARAAGPIWKEFMALALADQPAVDFPVPQGVEFHRIDPETGYALPPGGQGGFFEAYKEGTAPQPAPAEGPVVQGAKPEDFLESQTFALPGEGGATQQAPQAPAPGAESPSTH